MAMPEKKSKKGSLSIEELETQLREFLKAEWVRVLEEDGEPYSKYDMGYAVAILPRRVRGRVLRQKVVALVRINTRKFGVMAVIPIDPEVIDKLHELVREAEEERIRLEEEERRKQREERLKKWLESLSPEEREILQKLVGGE
ncbi:MAG: hypothetical protein DRJ67_09410 [Thermoprotei archaeon]|nr:MAG: hypothetical protein DRJ67_09410 [Thermoprotei archaeon]